MSRTLTSWQTAQATTVAALLFVSTIAQCGFCDFVDAPLRPLASSNYSASAGIRSNSATISPSIAPEVTTQSRFASNLVIEPAGSSVLTASGTSASQGGVIINPQTVDIVPLFLSGSLSTDTTTTTTNNTSAIQVIPDYMSKRSLLGSAFNPTINGGGGSDPDNPSAVPEPSAFLYGAIVLGVFLFGRRIWPRRRSN